MCGENLLTEDDLKATQALMSMADKVNLLLAGSELSEKADNTVFAGIQMHGRGFEGLEITPEYSVY